MFNQYNKENLVYKFEKEPDFEVELRQPTALDEVSLERFLRKDPTMFEALLYRIALISVRSNIQIEGDEFLISEDDVIGERIIKFYDLPVEMVMELSNAIDEFCPAWKLTE
jgi:hypothetical protein